VPGAQSCLALSTLPPPPPPPPSPTTPSPYPPCQTHPAYAAAGESGIDERVRQAAIAFEGPFAMADLRERFPGVPTARLRRLLVQLRGEGVLASSGRGRGTRWRVAGGCRRSAIGNELSIRWLAHGTQLMLPSGR